MNHLPQNTNSLAELSYSDIYMIVTNNPEDVRAKLRQYVDVMPLINTRTHVDAILQMKEAGMYDAMYDVLYVPYINDGRSDYAGSTPLITQLVDPPKSQAAALQGSSGKFAWPVWVPMAAFVVAIILIIIWTRQQ